MFTKKVQTFGRKRNAIAVAQVTDGNGLIRVNGVPLENLEPAELRIKAFEPLFILGSDVYSNINIRMKVSGGGHVAQIYAVRQAIARAVIVWSQKYIDESTKVRLKNSINCYDRSLIVSDLRRCEAKKFGGRGARARRQKSYR